MTTGIVLQKLRERKNFSREQLAELLSVSKKTYDRIEQGERELSLSEASSLSELYDVPIETFLMNAKTYINHGNVSYGLGSGHIENFTVDPTQLEDIKNLLKELHSKIDKFLKGD